ncbi:MBL fold metallo-hydrolase [Halocatena pleomorpha]|uniref:MBL fold metallo-hydrolase n=1 Tax=Halocatena pleomorpha TaxID=1785090 RepID=A0A3P3R8Q5_9EURY|nr:MBL fold metallo-hydrolase [Halocatena pleomorpha]RRJ29765.1 MBL fold metallo-hydrolase [Halocatena pleomorpha]
MRVTFLGTGSALPDGERFQTGLLLEHDRDPRTTASGPDDGQSGPLLVDCGSGVVHALARTGVGYEGISTVLLTHHHLDHVSDLLVLLKARWLAGTEQLTLVGPAGTRELLDDLLSAHEYMSDKVDVSVREVEPGSFACSGFDVEAIETRHSMDCLAYRFEDGDATFTFSGDSEAFDALGAFADGSDVLAHDCSFPDEIDVSNHPTPTQLGESLAGRTIEQVLLTHLYPHTDGHHEEMLEAIQNHYDGAVEFARDGLCVEL